MWYGHHHGEAGFHGKGETMVVVDEGMLQVTDI